MILGRKPEIEAFARRPDPRLRGALIHGQDRTSVRELAIRILAGVAERPDDPFGVAQLGNADIEAERLDAELSALSLMGGRRVVHVRLTGDLGPREKVLAEAVEAHASDARRASAFLLIEAGALDKRSALRRAAEAAPAIASAALYEEETGDLGRLIRETLEAEQLRAPAALIARLADAMPRDRGSARQLLESLVLLVGPGSRATVTEADVEAVLGGEGGSEGAEIALTAFSGRHRELVGALQRARFLGEAGPAIVRQLSTHRTRLSRARAAVADGQNVDGALKSVGVFWKQAKEVQSQLSLWSDDALETIRAELLDADIACKTGGSPDEVIAHHAALTIADRAAHRRTRPTRD